MNGRRRHNPDSAAEGDVRHHHRPGQKPAQIRTQATPVINPITMVLSRGHQNKLGASRPTSTSLHAVTVSGATA